jgi:hypothetical protein
MRWLVIAVIALVISSLVMRFSRLAAVLIIAAVAVIGAFAWYQEHELAASKRRIPLDQVELVDFKLVKPDRNTRELMGRIRNHSTRYTITEADLEVVMDDCRNGHCDTVDQTRVIFTEPIPPEQARDIKQRIVFDSLQQPRGVFEPRFNLLYVEAQ